MMKGILPFVAIALIANIKTAKALNTEHHDLINTEMTSDSSRLDELDRYWVELSRTVREGDFEGYKAAYHEDAVVIFATRESKTSLSISEALTGWEGGFIETKAGNVSSDVMFRFSQRIGNESTAHETGIFHYTSVDSNGNSLANSFTHFEMLLVKRNGIWYGLMEYQKSNATKEEWEALKFN